MGAPRVKCPSPLHVQQNDKIHASLYGLGIPVCCVCVCVCVCGRRYEVVERRTEEEVAGMVVKAG